jgi:hypothetical protein
MIATVVFSLIILAAFSMYQPIVRIANIIRSDADTQRIVNAAESYVARQVRSAAQVTLYTNVDYTALVTDIVGYANLWDRAGDFPQAIIITNAHDDDAASFIYNVRLEAGMTAANLPPVLDIENFRVFNRSFYAGVELDFEIEIEPEFDDWGSQQRDETFLTMSTNARHDDRELVSRSEDFTIFTWIGARGAPIPHPQPGPGIFEGLQFDGVDAAGNAAPGNDIVILYYNNSDLMFDVFSGPDCLICNDSGECCSDCLHECPAFDPLDPAACGC